MRLAADLLLRRGRRVSSRHKASGAGGEMEKKSAAVAAAMSHNLAYECAVEGRGCAERRKT